MHDRLYDKLVKNLEDQIRLYRSLLDVVRREKDILVASELDELNENNKAKEAMIIKLRGLEGTRQRYAYELCSELQISVEEPRLLDIANHIDSERGDRLRNIHSVLELLLKRVKDHNQQNETLVQAALNNITGAMHAIRDTLQENPTYRRKGKVEKQPAQSGQLVSAEA